MMVTVSAILFTILTVIVIIFQGCLAAGLPWGEASMGGKFPGKYPPRMRVVAVINMFLLAIFALVVLIRAELLLPQFFQMSKLAIWFIVAYSAISTVLNTITPSKIERIWAPVAGLQFITSILIAIN